MNLHQNKLGQIWLKCRCGFTRLGYLIFDAGFYYTMLLLIMLQYLFYSEIKRGSCNIRNYFVQINMNIQVKATRSTNKTIFLIWKDTSLSEAQHFGAIL